MTCYKDTCETELKAVLQRQQMPTMQQLCCTGPALGDRAELGLELLLQRNGAATGKNCSKDRGPNWRAQLSLTHVMMMLQGDGQAEKPGHKRGREGEAG